MSSIPLLVLINRKIILFFWQRLITDLRILSRFKRLASEITKASIGIFGINISIDIFKVSIFPL